MPQTLSAIPHFSPRPASRAAAKVQSQPSKDDKTFASLLGVEELAKTASASKKTRSGAASSKDKTNDDVAGFSQSGSDKGASSQTDTSLASNAAISNQNNQAQFIAAGVPAVSLASYIPVSATEEDVSVTQSSPSAGSSRASQKGGAGATATAAQDAQTTNGAVQSYETSGDKQASGAALSVGGGTTAATAVSSSAMDTAATSLKTSVGPAAPAVHGTPKNAKPSFAPKLAAADSSSATNTAAASLNTSLAPVPSSPDNPEPTLAPKFAAANSSAATDTAATSLNTPLTPVPSSPDNPEPTLAPQFAAADASSATDTAATSLKTSLAPVPSAPDNPEPTLAPKFAAADASSATDKAATSSNTPLTPVPSAPKNPEPILAPKFAASPNTTAKTSEAQSSPNFAQSGVTFKIAMPPSSADPVKAPGEAVVVASQTHFVPETAKAGHSVAWEIAAASSAPGQAAAAGQATVPSSPKELDTELSTSTASPANDVPPKIAAPALAPNQTDPSQTVAFAPSGTTAVASSTEPWSNMTTDGSSSADTQAGNAANSVSAYRQSVTPNAGGGGNSQDGSARDKASHNQPGDGPASASAEAPRPSEVSLAIPFGASGASPSTPAQQILGGIQRAMPAADDSQALTSAPQPTLDGQQPLKTITVALSPASLGTVTVELSLKSGQLGVKLRAQEADTVQLLKQDGSLEKLLESAGYAVQSLSIQLSPQPGQPTQAQGQAAPNGQSFSNPFSSSGSGQDQGRSQSHKEQPTDRNGDQRPGHGRTEKISGGGSLYL